MIKKIGVLTSGGDAPGMNAAIRGVVRSALTEGLEVMGIYDGYLGLYEDRMVQLDRYSVSDMINRGGTFLGSARFPEFRDENIRAVAIENLKKRGIDALVVIGGDGSYMGAMRLTEMGFPCIGLPGTIDNDIKGTDYTIGFFTALSTVVEAIDRLRDTSSSHQRISVVEVMGRYCGDLTLAAAIAGGCEFVVVPEVEFSREDLVNEIKAGIAKGKKHAIVAITEHMCDVNPGVSVIHISQPSISSISYVMKVSSRSLPVRVGFVIWDAANTVNICYVFAGKGILTGKKFLKLSCLIYMMVHPVIR